MPELDATTVSLGQVRAPTVDLWDDVLRLARRLEHDTTETWVRRWSPWLVPALATLLVGAVGLGAAGLWTDELATWGMSTVDSWSQFFWVLRYVDAVLAPYYVMMHVWVTVFGDSDVALRLPSLLAMVLAAGLLGALGSRLAGRSAGVLGGLVFAVLPSTSRFAAEVRPYALTVLAAVAATYFFVLACERPTAGRWIGYAVPVAALCLLNIVAVLLLVGHAWVVVAWHRRVWWRFALAAGGGSLVAAPLLWYGAKQRHQVSYIPRIGFDTFGTYAQVLFGGIVLALIVVGLALFSMPLRYPSAVLATWAIGPTLALGGVSAVVPMFLPRYLLFTMPAWAMLVGIALARLRLPWAVVAVVVVAALGLPSQVQMRSAGGHEQATSQLAAVIAGGARPGDAIVYADDEPVGGWTLRDTVAHYVPADRRPVDILATHPPRHDGLLLATECPDVVRCLGATDRVWLVRVGELRDPLVGVGAGKEAALRSGYRLVQMWYPAGLTVALIERRSPS